MIDPKKFHLEIGDIILYSLCTILYRNPQILYAVPSRGINELKGEGNENSNVRCEYQLEVYYRRFELVLFYYFLQLLHVEISG